MMNSAITESTLNNYDRFVKLKNSVDKIKVKTYFEKLENKTIKPFQVNIKVSNLLKEFILNDGIDLESKNRNYKLVIK